MPASPATQTCTIMLVIYDSMRHWRGSPRTRVGGQHGWPGLNHAGATHGRRSAAQRRETGCQSVRRAISQDNNA